VPFAVNGVQRVGVYSCAGFGLFPLHSAPKSVASKRSKVFHAATYGSAKKISDHNVVEFASIAEAEEAGRRPRKRCKPGG
jgi:hypothetical protein|tara:strand:+ start:294 stop:533 length:240 start_codon:yes stop_codon:yes gene_type:complete